MIDLEDGSVSREIQCVVRPASVDEVYEPGYLAANPDVQRSGDARRHFLTYGQREGRVQWVNEKEIAEMREQKLRRVKFRRDPTVRREYGQAPNFLSAEAVVEFAIPDTPPISSNPYGGPFVDEIRHNPDRLCLDVGAGLRPSCFGNIINADIYPSFSTDLVCVGEDLPFEDDQFDYVMCMAVLEHTLRPWEVARELCRVLKPEGKIMVDYPFLQRVHGYPHHYFNATPQGAISLFEKDCEIESSTVGPHQHPIYSIWGVLADWRQGLPESDRPKFEDLTVRGILDQPPEAHLDSFYCTNLSAEMLRVIPAGSTLIGKKRASNMNPTLPPKPQPRRVADERASDFVGSFRLHSELATAQMRVRTLEKRLADSEQRFIDVTASRSWRVTSPLRAAARLVRRLGSIVDRLISRAAYRSNSNQAECVVPFFGRTRKLR